MQRNLPTGLADFEWEDVPGASLDIPAPAGFNHEAEEDEFYLEDEDEDADDGDDFSMEEAFEGEDALFDREAGETHGPGLSAVAVHDIKRGLDMPKRPEPWRSGIYGLVVHATGRGKMWQTAVEAGRSPLPELMAYYNRRNGPGYINGWGGTGSRELVQMADERVKTARGIGISAQKKSVLSGHWERDLPDILVRKWRARWPGVSSPLDLLPLVSGSRKRAHPNSAYFHVECIPCPAKRYGLAEPLRPGMLYTRAQHDAIAALAVDIATRHRWPADTEWWRTSRLLGHEDLTPISRMNRRGGWDPGYLRQPMWFDFDYVHERIETLWRSRPGSGLNGVWGRITGAASDAASGFGTAVSGLLERGEAAMAVRRAIASGERDENKLTNIAFYAVNPDWRGRKIARGERAKAKEWIDLRDRVVRPLLQDEAEMEAEVKQFAMEEPFLAGEIEAEYRPDDGEEGPDESEMWNDEAPGEELHEDFDDDVTAAAFQASDLDDSERAPGKDAYDDPEDESEFLEAETGSAIVNYNLALDHALTHLDPGYFGHPWFRGRRRSDGSWARRPGKFPTADWEVGIDPDGFYSDRHGRRTNRHFGLLKLKPGRDPYDSLIAIVDHPERWSFDCATYVQAVHLYALAKSMGRTRINAFYARTPLRLRFFNSPGLRKSRSFRKNTRYDPWIVREGGRRTERRMHDNDLLTTLPKGSRVMWHNVEGRGSWMNENTVKTGPNRYRGFPLFWGGPPVKGWKIRMGLAAHARPDRDVMLQRLRTASGQDVQADTDLQALWQYTRRKVYLREASIIGPAPEV